MPRRLPPEKEAAVAADVPVLGVSATARKHGVSKGYVSKIAAANDVKTFTDQTRQAAETREAHCAELRTQVAHRMWEIADTASRRELELIRASKAPDLRSVVGARTRAIHDAELLSGRATARTEHVEPIDVELERLAAEVKARADTRS